MFESRSRAAAAMLILVASPGCGGGAAPAADAQIVESESGAYVARFVPDPSPPTTGSNALAVSIERATGGAVENATLVVSPWMPAMGHGTPITPVVTNTSGGNYRVTRLDYTMPGRWEVRIELADGTAKDHLALELDVE